MATFGVDAGELQVQGIYLINQKLRSRIWLRGRESPCTRTCRQLPTLQILPRASESLWASFWLGMVRNRYERLYEENSIELDRSRRWPVFWPVHVAEPKRLPVYPPQWLAKSASA